MKSTIFTVVFLALLFAVSGTEINIGGNFQPAAKSVYPMHWWGNGVLKKVKIAISAPDAGGRRTVELKSHLGAKEGFALYGTLPVKIFPGDILTLTGEARVPKGKASAGFYIYNLPKSMYGRQMNLPESREFRHFSFTYKAVVCNNEVRPVLGVNGPGEAAFRNLSLKVKRAPGSWAEKRKFRFYSVYRIAKAPADVREAEKLFASYPEGSGFTELKRGYLIPEKYQSRFKMAHDGKKLYIYLKMGETRIDLVRSDPGNYQDGVRSDDHMEFAATYDRKVKKSYMVCNFKGASYIANSPEKLTVSTRYKAPFMEFLIAIDFKHVLPDEKKVEFEKEYFFNIGRTHMAGVQLTHSSFAKNFANPIGFALLSFHDRLPLKKQLRDGEMEMNSDYYRHLIERGRMLNKLSPDKFKSEYGKFGNADESSFRKLKKLGAEMVRCRDFRKLADYSKTYESLHENLTTAKREVTLLLDDPAAVQQIFVNGQKYEPAPRLKVSLKEGLTVFAAVTRPGAQVKLRIAEAPEADNLWRTAAPAAGNQWQFPGFNDSIWNMAQVKEGRISSKGILRQVILWNRNHQGNERIFPLCREWLFAAESLEGLRYALYSPLPYKFSKMRLTFDMPENIELLPFPDLREKFRVPVSVTSRRSAPGRKKLLLDYTNIPSDGTHYSYMSAEFRKSASLTPGKVFAIHYSRSSGNFVELTQTLPCKVVPKVNGRQPVRYYVMATNFLRGVFSEKQQSRVLEQLARAGFNCVTDTSESTEIGFRLTEKALSLGINPHIGTTLYPIWGCHTLVQGELFKYLQKTPEAQAVRYDPSVTFNKPAIWWNRMYCPTHVLGKGRAKFMDAVKKDMANFYLFRNPLAEVVWLNWEGFPWRSNAPYCFCDKCKNEFKKTQGLPENTQLPNTRIKKEFYREWELFRIKQDARIMELTRFIIAALGKRCMIYSQTGQEDFWKATYGTLDQINPGLPGNGPGDSKFQYLMDRDCALMRQRTGHEILVGQQMVPFYAVTTGKNAYRKEFLASNSGVLEPELFKAVFLRTAAALRGGLMWYGVLGGPICGMHYYIGEATRIIAEFEPLFLYGVRRDELVKSPEIAYPNALVLCRDQVILPRKYRTPGKRGNERLVMLFNEKEQAINVSLKNLKLAPHARGLVWETGKEIKNPAEMNVTVPARNSLTIYIYEK